MSTDTQSFEFTNVENGRTSDGHRSQYRVRPYKNRGIDTTLELPPPGAMRWGVRSKAAVVIAIRKGMLSLEEACTRYALSTSEYRTWEYGLDTGGLNGLGLAGRQEHRRSLMHSGK